MEFYTMEQYERISDVLDELREEAALYGTSVEEYLAYVDDYADADGKLWD